MQQPDEQAFYDSLTDQTRRDMHRAEQLGYEVDVHLHLGEESARDDVPYGVEIALRPKTNQARLRLTLKGLDGQMIRATAPFVRDDPSVDCIAVEEAMRAAIDTHDRWLGLVVA